MIPCPKCQQQMQQLTRCREFPTAGQVSEIQTRAVHTLASEARISGWKRGGAGRGLEGIGSCNACPGLTAVSAFFIPSPAGVGRVELITAEWIHWRLLWGIPVTSSCYHCLNCIISFHLSPERGWCPELMSGQWEEREMFGNHCFEMPAKDTIAGHWHILQDPGLEEKTLFANMAWIPLVDNTTF